MNPATRKIVRRNGFYEVLKPDNNPNNSGFHKTGRKYSSKGLQNLLVNETVTYQFVAEQELLADGEFKRIIGRIEGLEISTQT